MSTGAPHESPARHAAITAALRDEIRSGQRRAGESLPSEAELSARFAVSRGTVRQALAALRADGLIAGGRGRRPVVSRPSVSQSFDQLVSFSAWAENAGFVPGARLLELALRPASAETVDALGLTVGSRAYEYRRLRLLDGVPAMIEVTTFVERIGRWLVDFDLDTGSVYEQLAARGVEFDEAHQTISAVAATAEQAELLGVPRRSALLQVRRVVFERDGTAAELSYDTYRGDTFTISLHNRVAVARSGVRLGIVTSGDR